MSKNFVAREEAINQLYASIKTKFQQDGVLEEVRCLLQAKMVAMMQGSSDIKTLVQMPSPSADGHSITLCITLLHQLIMEYFQWHGLHYSAQMFSQESGCENVRPLRESLEAILGNFENKSVPILLQLVANRMENHNPNLILPHHLDNRIDSENNKQ
ncbi:uncharacterized protein LOC142236993 [Haematobia irritans]|uniref:uncharacterized protein LOC142236993 n=1 Tax=Haematobia irritans TaxID=7368 RepID=UPI003F50CEE0